MSIINALRLEYAKFKDNAVIGLLLIFFVLAMPSVIFVGKEFNDLPDPLPDNSIFFNFPMVWDYQGYIGGWLVFFFLGLVSVFIVVNEISYKTFRQNIINGLTRHQYFLNKVYVILALSLFAALYYALICIVIGTIHAGEFDVSDVFYNSWAIPRFFLMTFGYCSFGLFCGFVLRRSGVAILGYLLFILMIEPLLKWAVHFRAWHHWSVNYYPFNSIEDLMPFPLYRFADMIPKKQLDFDFLLTYQQATISSIVWIAIFLFVAYRMYMKRDM